MNKITIATCICMHICYRNCLFIYKFTSLIVKVHEFLRVEVENEIFAFSAGYCDSARGAAASPFIDWLFSAPLRVFDPHPGTRPKRHSKPAHLQPRPASA